MFETRLRQQKCKKHQKHDLVMKQALLAPIWTRIGVPYIVWSGESDYDTPGAQFCEKTTKNEQKHELLMKWVAVAPIWLRICVSCIIFRTESGYDTPGAQFCEKTTKIGKTCWCQKHQSEMISPRNWRNQEIKRVYQKVNFGLPCVAVNTRNH